VQSLGYEVGRILGFRAEHSLGYYVVQCLGYCVERFLGFLAIGLPIAIDVYGPKARIKIKRAVPLATMCAKVPFSIPIENASVRANL
jgi:hypothetical protein